MSNQWEKNQKQTKMKALVLAVLIHLVFLVGATALFSGSGGEGIGEKIQSVFGKKEATTQVEDKA